MREWMAIRLYLLGSRIIGLSYKVGGPSFVGAAGVLMREVLADMKKS